MRTSTGETHAGEPDWPSTVDGVDVFVVVENLGIVYSISTSSSESLLQSAGSTAPFIREAVDAVLFIVHNLLLMVLAFS